LTPGCGAIAGGLGGGGNGGGGAPSTQAAGNGVANTGGGGGGVRSGTGGSGGAGYVIVQENAYCKSVAPGIWSMNTVYEFVKDGNWV
tara:strand:- start:60 stop:320 length:261 start_codon:yes stop_codon:yes gene_type:complete